MTNLIKLEAGEDCGIGDSGIHKLNLEELSANGNPKITNVNHLTNLTKLIASDSCGIGDSGIQKLNLIELYASMNPKITNTNHLTNLTLLVAGGRECWIDNAAISKVNLPGLGSLDNRKITHFEIPSYQGFYYH